MEGPHRLGERHGREPDRPGTRHREGRDRRRRRQPAPEADGRSEGGGGGARRNHQQHDGHARHLRRAGDERRPRGRRRGPARRTGQRARRGRHLEGPHREREPPRGEPVDAGPRDRRGGDRRHQGRPHTLHPGRGPRRGRRAQRQHQHDDRQPAGHDRPQPGTGLAEDQPGEVHPHAAGSARSRDRGQAPAVGARSARPRAAGVRLPDAGSARQRAGTATARGLRDRGRPGEAHRGRQRPDWPVRAREAADSAHEGAAAVHPHPLQPWQRASEEHRRPAGALRRRDEGRHRAGIARAVHRHAPHLPRAAHAVDRRRAQHHRSDDADREPAAAVAAADHGAADATGRAAADERGARVEGEAAGRAERRGRAQEQGSRARAPCARRTGGGTGAHLEVQVGVPGQHVARAAHATQLDPDPRPAALREPGRQPAAPPGRIRAEHPLGRQRPA